MLIQSVWAGRVAMLIVVDVIYRRSSVLFCLGGFQSYFFLFRKILMLIPVFWLILNPLSLYQDYTAIQQSIIFCDLLFPLPLCDVVCP